MDIPGSAASPGPDELIDLVGRQVLAAQAKADTAAALVARIGDIRSSETSPYREVSVTVDSSGRLVDISFTESAARRTPAELSRVVIEAAARAQRRAAREAVALADEAFGEGSGLSTQMIGEYEARLGSLDEDKRGSR